MLETKTFRCNFPPNITADDKKLIFPYFSLLTVEIQQKGSSDPRIRIHAIETFILPLKRNVDIDYPFLTL